MKIDDLEKMEAEATEGPWKCDEYGNLMAGKPSYDVPTGSDQWSMENIVLMAALRNAAPAMMKVMKGVKAVLEGEGPVGQCVSCGLQCTAETKVSDHKKDCPNALLEQGLAEFAALEGEG